MSKEREKSYNRGYVVITVPSIVVYKGSSRSQDRPESPTVVVQGGMPSLPSSEQGLAVGGSGALHQNASESDMIDNGNANPSVGTSPSSNSLHRPAFSCPLDKSDTENKNFRNRVCVIDCCFLSLFIPFPHFSIFVLKFVPY